MHLSKLCPPSSVGTLVGRRDQMINKVRFENHGAFHRDVLRMTLAGAGLGLGAYAYTSIVGSAASSIRVR